MTEISEAKEKEEEVRRLAIWDCGSPLYDSYELVSLSHLIERHLMAIPSLGGSKRLTAKFYVPYDDVSNAMSVINAEGNSSASIMSMLSESLGRIGQRKDKRKRLKKIGLSGFCNRFGFWKK